MGKNTLRIAILNAILLTGGTLAYAETAYAQGQTQSYSIEAGDLESVLSRFGTQSRIQLIYPPELLKGKRSNGLTGSHTPTEALRRLLEGSGLEAERVNDSTVVIKRAAVPAPAPQAATRNAPANTQTTEPEVRELEPLTVTGTRIRGGQTPSPVITIGIENIREEGFTDLGEVIRSVPQNFRGGQNPGVASGAANGAGGLANQNFTGGSTLNLRGLGPDASLTLLNGRRMSYGSFIQAVDISAIPVEAVERIEIVADGASAIYGSDAVGGVGNVILKRDFDGVSVGVRYGTATDGGMSTREYSATAGTTWSSGGVIATYKYASVDPIYAADREYTEFLHEPTTIYPGSRLRGGLLSAYQSLGENIEFRLDALRTRRDQEYYYWYAALPMLYAKLAPETTTALVSPSLDVLLPNDWTLSIGVTRGKDEHLQRNFDVMVDTGQPILYMDECYCNESRSYELGAEGRLFSLPGGDARLAVGAGYRTNEYWQFNYITDAMAIQGDESSRFAYAEIHLPLVGSDDTSVGLHRLALTAAARSEDYDTFGSVTTPKLGLIYGPNADITMKASWGRSFKAPTLFQRYYPNRVQLVSPLWYGGTGYPADATALTISYGNRDLEAEHARTWTASLAFHPEAVPGLEAELTWFDIDYTDRVIQPITNFAEAMTTPAYAQFIEFAPSAERQAAVIAAADAFFNFSGLPTDPDNVVAIIDFRYVNASRQRIKGLDLTGSYRFDLGAGRLTVRGSASWLDSTQQISAGQPSYDMAGTVYNPAKLNSRVGAVWTQGGFTVSTFANYTSGVTNTAEGEKTTSFTTADATLRYFLEGRGGRWPAWDIALSAQNLLDRAPPLHRNTTGDPYWVPYDSTNYSAIGRLLSLSVSMHW